MSILDSDDKVSAGSDPKMPLSQFYITRSTLKTYSRLFDIFSCQSPRISQPMSHSFLLSDFPLHTIIILSLKLLQNSGTRKGLDMVGWGILHSKRPAGEIHGRAECEAV
jgi:hypothetical protein